MLNLLYILLTVVYLERSNTLNFDEERLPDAQILVGDVCFRHDSAYMYCDSAYYFESNNSLTAMGNVRLIQGDTLSGYGDILYYDGNSKLGRFRHHVRLIHHQSVLTTDSLNYDRANEQAYYFGGGTLRDTVNTLTSTYGLYYTSTSDCTFHEQVHLINKDFTLDTDTLLYNTESHWAQIVCPTTIVDTDTTTILCHNGTYNTETHYAKLHEDVAIHQKDTTSTYLAADTIHLWNQGDSIIAYHKVRIYREDAQMVCDSVRYVANDSMIYLYQKPILWNENNQMAADSFHLYLRDQELDRIHGLGHACSVQQCQYDSSRFNQLSGKEMWGYCIEQQLRQVDFLGNAETIFYPDDKGEYIGLNTTQSPNVNVYIQDQQIERIRLSSATTGTMYPIEQIPAGAEHLALFFWAADERPISPEDVRRKVTNPVQRPEVKQEETINEDDNEENTNNTPVRTRGRRSRRR